MPIAVTATGRSGSRRGCAPGPAQDGRVVAHRVSRRYAEADPHPPAPRAGRVRRRVGTVCDRFLSLLSRSTSAHPRRCPGSVASRRRPAGTCGGRHRFIGGSLVRRTLAGSAAFLAFTGTFVILPVYAAPGPKAPPVEPAIEEVALGSVAEPEGDAVVTADGEPTDPVEPTRSAPTTTDAPRASAPTSSAPPSSAPPPRGAPRPDLQRPDLQRAHVACAHGRRAGARRRGQLRSGAAGGPRADG